MIPGSPSMQILHCKVLIKIMKITTLYSKKKKESLHVCAGVTRVYMLGRLIAEILKRTTGYLPSSLSFDGSKTIPCSM